MNNKNTTVTMMIIIAYIVTFLFGANMMPIFLYATVAMGIISFFISAKDLKEQKENRPQHVLINTVISGIYVIYIGIIVFILFIS